MTDAEWKELGRYIRWCANEIGLRDWTLELYRDPPRQRSNSGDEEVHANVCVTAGRQLAIIRVAANFRTLTPEVQRNAVIHELLHCHLDQTWRVIGEDLYGSELLTPGQYRLLKSSFVRAEENATDAIATAVAKHFPLVEWPDNLATLAPDLPAGGVGGTPAADAASRA